MNDAATVFEEFLPAPGDFNRNGFVDAADYTVWRDGFGALYDEADYAESKSDSAARHSESCDRFAPTRP